MIPKKWWLRLTKAGRRKQEEEAEFRRRLRTVRNEGPDEEDRNEAQSIMRQIQEMPWPWPIVRVAPHRGNEGMLPGGLLLLIGAPRDRALVQTREIPSNPARQPWSQGTKPKVMGQDRFMPGLAWRTGAGWWVDVRAAPSVVNEAWSVAHKASIPDGNGWSDGAGGYILPEDLRWLAGVARAANQAWEDGPRGGASGYDAWGDWTRSEAPGGYWWERDIQADEEQRRQIRRIAREEGIGDYPQEVQRLEEYAGLYQGEPVTLWPAQVEDWEGVGEASCRRYAWWCAHMGRHDSRRHERWTKAWEGCPRGIDAARTLVVKGAMAALAAGESCGLCEGVPGRKDEEDMVGRGYGVLCSVNRSRTQGEQRCRLLEKAQGWGWRCGDPHILDGAIWGTERALQAEVGEGGETDKSGREGRQAAGYRALEPWLGIRRAGKATGFSHWEVQGEAGGEGIPLPGEGHVMTVAPTGAGKTTGQIIPVLLACEDNAVVVDLKGEIHRATAARRRAMGHRVLVVDPCGVVDDEGRTSIDPLAELRGRTEQSVWRDLARTLQRAGEQNSKQMMNEEFWLGVAADVVGALCAHVAHDFTEPKAGLREVGKIANLTGDSLEHRLAAVEQCSSHPVGRGVRAAWHTGGNAGEGNFTGSVRATVQQNASWLDDPAVEAALRPGGWEAGQLVRSPKTTLYLVIPPERAKGLGKLLALLLSTLIEARIRAGTQAPRTLFVVDESAMLGEMEALRTAITLTRGYGVQMWTAWQDLAQIERWYRDWTSLIANSKVVCAFGTLPAGELAWLVDRFGPQADEQIDVRALQHHGVAACLRPEGQSCMMTLDWSWQSPRYRDLVGGKARGDGRGAGREHSIE